MSMAGDYSPALSQRRKPPDGRHNGFPAGSNSPDRGARSASAADNFLKAFEKPTQIYRYMNTRSRKVSFLLHRNLSYMKPRMSRTNQRRGGFKIDDMMDRFLCEIEAQAMRDRRDLSLTFKSFEDPHLVAGGESGSAIISASIISVETNPSSRREQEVRKTLMSMDKEVPITSGASSKFSVRMKFDKDIFPQMTKHFVKCLLVITVRLNPVSAGKGQGSPDSKRRKKAEVPTTSQSHLFRSSEIMIFDSRMERQLHSGKYQVVSKLESGNSKTDAKAQVFMEVFWNEPPLPPVRTSNGFMHCALPATRPLDEGLSDEITIFYQFVTQNECQETRTKIQNLLCPWCHLNCLILKSLAAHLKNMHPRFSFRFRCEAKGNRTEVHVDVSPNELFDGSYSGNPHDLSHSSTASRMSQGPMRRIPFTVILVNKKTDFNAALMDGDDDDADQLRPTIHGHDRLYYHTNTCIPIRPQDMDIDSEDENDPQWMRYKTQQMLDEFTDVNDGEKEVMKLWNLHIMKYGFTGDCQIPEACRIFLEERGEVLREKNLRYNFILHLISLYDYGLIDAVEKANLIRKLNQIFKRSYPIVSNGHSVLSQSNGSKDDKGCRLA